MLTLISEERMLEKLQTVYTTDESEMSTETFRLLVMDACRFVGAATNLCRQIENHRHQHIVASLTSKSWQEDFLIIKHGCDRYWAHAATNLITHRNLPPVDVSSMDDFVNEPFYRKFTELGLEYNP